MDCFVCVGINSKQCVLHVCCVVLCCVVLCRVSGPQPSGRASVERWARAAQSSSQQRHQTSRQTTALQEEAQGRVWGGARGREGEGPKAKERKGQVGGCMHCVVCCPQCASVAASSTHPGPAAPLGSKQSNGDTHNNDDVVVIEHRPRGRHQGAAPRGKPRTRHERGRGARGQGFGRPPREGRSRNGRSEMLAKPSVPPEPATEELWDSDPAPQVDGVSQGCVANQDEVRVPSLGDDSWGGVGVSEGQVSYCCLVES